ncbi:DUF4391 domain-containing protein [Shewanella xiamenensis]|uniref:DUF4391 domain-containing protein n=1 Tax=Shewanella xiamenensis TaxID=332186 RepID=UPI001C4F8EA6|nr:DUF4391 domain-containing protein [Shewanella xiamenensis]MBW0281490.1 methyl-accepting chemotaxis protein [Shewanella xiamenensis]MCT8872137.1 DUF4391 domain-containing protein [Shewanella xiamenensis]UWH40045.1 DUF4391 domain-containing protein [Shewanella xiamenensis]
MSNALAAVTKTALISYPKQAEFGRVVPKNKIYEHSGANTKQKELFIEQVEQIVWQYKLAPETINLPAKPDVPELQIFSIQLKTPELNWDVLRCIDGAVPYPIIFELSFAGRTQVVAAYKRTHDADANRWVVSDYFATAWLPSDSVRAPMPTTLNLGLLYEQLLMRLLPIVARPYEPLAELLERVVQVKAKQREMEKVASKLAKERQFNRRVEMNSLLRQLTNELEQLTDRKDV